MDETQADDTLAKRAAEDVEAFTTLYRRYLQRVYSYLLSRVGNVQDTQDLTAQTFLAVLKSLPEYEARGMFNAWILSIARRKAMDHFRQNAQIIHTEVSDTLPDQAPSPDALVLERLQMQELAALLDRLNPDRAEALRLRFFGELKMREIATVMDKSEGAVKMLVARGLEDIRKLMEQQEAHS